MVRNTLKKEYEKLVNDSHVLCLEDAAYRKAIAPYRKVAGLSPLPLHEKKPVSFSGEWKFDEDASTLDNSGTGSLPYQLTIDKDENGLSIKRTMVSEYGDNTVTDEQLALDGKEKAFKAPFGNVPKMVTARQSENGDTLFIDSKITFTNSGRTSEWITNEVWALKEEGKVLSVKQTSNSFRGKRSVTAIYNKE
jgi:hypothetical protein